MAVNTLISMLLLLISYNGYLVMKKLTGERLTWPMLIFPVLTSVFTLARWLPLCGRLSALDYPSYIFLISFCVLK